MRLVSGAECIREYKFSILDPASNYAEGLEGEQVLLQGVVDCAILDPDGITVIDFKTDRVTEETVLEAVERYRPQVMAYSSALGRIFEMDICERYLYFFSIGKYVSI
jgi:ATP-dependent helicase/nuclease subunit A